VKLLLDTCSFLWITNAQAELSSAARVAFEDDANESYLSVVSAWEIALKNGLRNLPLPEPAQVFLPRARALHKIESLNLNEDAIVQLPLLPLLHRDPFDRMLICQAIAEGMVIVTPDELIRRYPVRTIW
jgi:PIN domain nuclease of toxin-antitoxin system